MYAIARVGMTDRLRHRPSELSGGDATNCPIARTIVTSLIGLFFGFYPAYPATCIDPVAALRNGLS
jgi:ABC-type polar amino acid transport system ATPase subunit